MNKKIILGLIGIAIIYGCIQLFNHVNPWFGIGAFAVLIFAILNYFSKQKTKKKENENN